MISLSFSIQLIPWNLKKHKAVGLDGLTAETLKVSLDVSCDNMTYLVSKSLSSGVFPTILNESGSNL